MKSIATIAVLILSSLSLAQGPPSEAAGGHLRFDGRQQAIQVGVGGDPQAAIDRCMKATDRVRKTAVRMSNIGTFWGRGRISYSQKDLSSLLQLDEQLEGSLADLSSTHERFHGTLKDTDSNLVQKQLKKLEKVQLKMRSEAMQVHRELLGAKPGPASANITWGVAGLKSATNKWLSEHKKMAKEMNLAVREDQREVPFS